MGVSPTKNCLVPSNEGSNEGLGSWSSTRPALSVRTLARGGCRCRRILPMVIAHAHRHWKEQRAEDSGPKALYPRQERPHPQQMGTILTLMAIRPQCHPPPRPERSQKKN